jgi:hypothetical protein
MAATFWLLLALIIVIVAAAVGGGVGGSMAVSNARTQCLATSSAAGVAQSTTTTDSPAIITANPTATSISPESLGFSAGKTATAWGPLQTSLPYTGCPANNGSAYTSCFPNSKFELYCSLDTLYTGASDLLCDHAYL